MRARENPLASARTTSLRYKFLSGSWSELQRKLRDANFRATILGAEGVGKSTLLNELKEVLEGEGWDVIYCRLTEDKGLPSSFWRQKIGKNMILLVDSAGLLNWITWKMLLFKSQSAGGFIVTSHKSNELTTIIECESSFEIFEQLLNELVDGTVTKADAQSAYNLANGNVRKAFFHLYDQLAIN